MSQLPDHQTQPQFYRDVPMKRFLAWIADTVVILAASLLIVPFTAFTGLFFFPALVLVVSFLYRVITLANGSATWGMRLVAIEFRRADGDRFDLGTAFAHTLGYSISWTIMVLQLISMVLMCTTDRGQGLTDHVLGTVAINRRAAV
ncbi:RDD family protein [Sulfitobacter sabulilitoris]|uniref:RDD family protein n=1 Tax=Sulfitobacter sabulilitoris TaxID=2562655 RepID=A0A5S3PJA8_9RHOB|nr:RDD family protein [Sulfitobacter sabulilitoris]TMM54427.1 RDD family protein [Sulfitobacter sabulilitoris]